jgi:ABC-type multidrug transport system fused ATPase/permease subunit
VQPALPSEPASATGPLVAFDSVSFRYRSGGPPVLEEVSFDVSARGLTALVGPSGAGKTTLFALLERFYELQAGAITFAGRDLADWPRAALRAQMGYVEQDAPVLAGTLRDNLVYAAPDASEASVLEALREARLEELVARLPEGLDTTIGARGTTLSGGERQRIAIARPLIRRPALLLLDEAASQLDAVNELALRDTGGARGSAGRGAGDRPPSVHRRRRTPDRRPRTRTGARGRHARGAGSAGRALRRARRDTVQRELMLD